MKNLRIANLALLAIVAIESAFIFTGCNRDMVDLNYTYHRAIIDTLDEVVVVDVKQWRDYDDGDQIQITTTDGTVFLVHSSRCTLIENP